MDAATTREDNDGAVTVPITEARADFAGVLDRVREGNIVYLTRHGKRVGAVVPPDVAETYERLEEQYWRDRYDAAPRGDTVPWRGALAEVEARD